MKLKPYIEKYVMFFLVEENFYLIQIQNFMKF